MGSLTLTLWYSESAYTDQLYSFKSGLNSLLIKWLDYVNFLARNNMEALALFGTWAIGAFSSFTAQSFSRNLYSTTPNISAELGPQLSSSAVIVLPDDASWVNVTTRWQSYSIPSYRAVVEVVSERDIQETVSSFEVAPTSVGT
jgi:hypothetical protein